MAQRLGSGKVVFGSGSPFIDLRYSRGRTIFAEIPETEQLAILGGAAARLFGWRDAPALPQAH